MTFEEDRLVQLIPAPGWWAAYGPGPEWIWSPLVAWGLTAGGEVVPLDANASGQVEDARRAEDFAQVEYRV